MVIRLFYLLLFGAVPMVLPFSIFVLFKSMCFLNTQIEYSKDDLEAGLDEVTERTIQIRTIAKTEGLPISPSSWVFHVAEEKQKLALSEKRSSENGKKKENKIVDRLVAQAAEIYPAPFDVIEAKKSDIAEEDPFLKEWKEKKGEGYPYLSIQKRLDNQSLSERDGYQVAQNDVDIQPKQTVNPSQSEPVSPKKIIENGKESAASILNMDMTDGGYLSYTTVEGEVALVSQEVVECFYEVSFYDRLNENGVDDEFSTVIASQEIRDKSKQFTLRIPSESSGVLVAKAYSWDDMEKKNPIYLGTYEKKPLIISKGEFKQGAKNLKIALYPRDEYLSQYLTQLRGKIYNEYAGRDPARCVSFASVWVLELNQHTTTNEQCVFEVRGMALGVPYHLLFEKEGFAALVLSMKLQQKKESQVFYMSPMAKFTQGYDLLLGARNPDKSVLFATIYKGGKPLERAIVKAPKSEKVVYERISDLGSFPDETLFSSMSNGKVTLWNVDSGKVSLDVFYNGAHLGRRLVRLIPGITHQIKIDF